jgi:hypothetical protein
MTIAGLTRANKERVSKQSLPPPMSARSLPTALASASRCKSRPAVRLHGQKIGRPRERRPGTRKFR